MLLCDWEIRSFCVPDTIGENKGIIAPLDGFFDDSKESFPYYRRYRWEQPMIEPFSEAVSGNGIISRGLSHSGYDLSVDPSEALIFKASYGEEIDPKKFKDESYKNRLFDRISLAGGVESFVIPSHSYVLIQSLEYIRMPRFLQGQIQGKSTYARCGLIVNCTKIEGGWHGRVTIEISNSAPCPGRIYVGEGIAQLDFHVLSSEPEKDYSQKEGKYMNQTSVTPPRVL